MFVKEFGCEIKVNELGFKDIDSKQGIVIGYFSSFGNKDSDGDIIVKGAYAKTIQERGPKSAKPRIKHLLDHSRYNTVAVIQDLQEDEKGLRYESKAGRHISGQDWIKMCEDGIVTEHSVGFETEKQDKKDDANYITEIKLWEGSSLQAWGASPFTEVVGVKELSIKQLGDRFALLEKAIRTGTYSDETFMSLEKELKAIKNQLIKLDETTEPGGAKNDHTTQPSAIDSWLLKQTLNNYTNNLMAEYGTKRTASAA
jgi:HK97 family phage prohead protease